MRKVYTEVIVAVPATAKQCCVGLFLRVSGCVEDPAGAFDEFASFEGLFDLALFFQVIEAAAHAAS